MKTIMHSNRSRPRFARIVSATAFGILIGAFAIGPVNADEHHGGHGRGRGHEERHEYRGRGYERGPDIVYGNPDYYYAPGPDYYYQPDPYSYGYYPPEPGYYYPPERPEGFNLFFGL
jgi:hypothetical protein